MKQFPSHYGVQLSRVLEDRGFKGFLLCYGLMVVVENDHYPTDELMN